MKHRQIIAAYAAAFAIIGATAPSAPAADGISVFAKVHALVATALTFTE